MKLLPMEPVKQVLARIDRDVAITAAAPDVHGDLPASERDLVSDDDGEGEGGEMESIPDETDYAGNLHDEFEAVLAMQEQQVTMDMEQDLHQREPDGEEAPLWGEIAASPSDQPKEFHPPSSPPSPSPNHLLLVPTPFIPPSQASRKQHPKEDTRVTIPRRLRPSVERRHPSAALPEPSRSSGRFHLIGEVITEFSSPTQWMQGTMVQAFGEVCCRATHSRSEYARRVDILPSEFLTMLERSNRGIEGDRLELEMQIRRCLHPDRCGMWLIPICHNSHWWLVKVDWINEAAVILDSFSSRGQDAKEVLTFARKIVAKIHEVLKKSYVPWRSFSLDPVSPDVSRISPSLNYQ